MIRPNARHGAAVLLIASLGSRSSLADEAPPGGAAPVAAAESTVPQPPVVVAPPVAVAPAVLAPSPYDVVRRFSLNDPSARVQLRGYFELGLASVVDHTYQASRDGTKFDYRTEGGQDSAFFFWRLSGELRLFDRHNLILLYQPLDLRTRSTLTRDVRVDALDFPKGTPMEFRYGFDFYRVSYLYDFFKDPRQELGIGLSLQLRVADIEFASLDGRLQRTSQNLGLVPILKARGRYTFKNEAFIGFEIDGIAVEFPSADTGSFVFGILFDASVRAGWSITNFLEVFVNLRYLGGGARGPGSKPDFGDGYVDNMLNTVTASIGLGFK